MDRVRLLDLVLGYALDNPGIHQNDPDNLRQLREMHALVLRASVEGKTIHLVRAKR